MEADYDAQTILAATADNTPVALTVAEQRIVGRKTGGNIAALTAAEVVTLLGIGIDSTPDSDHLAEGIKTVFTANENQAFGDVCYIDSDGEAHLADADAIATAKVVAMCADATINASASGNYLLLGIARDDTWNWTVGGWIYLSTTGTTGNTLTQTAPSGTDDCIVIVGVATHADRMLFSPQLVIVEHV